MNKEDMIKYLVMAAGAYLLWQWLTRPGGILAAQLPAATGDGAGADKTDGGGFVTQEKIVSKPPTSASPTPTNAQILAAALSVNNAGQTGGWRQSAYAWNWYRAEAGKQMGWTPEEIAAKAEGDLGSALDMSASYTAAEYHAALAQTGLEGLGRAQSWGGGPRYSYQ